MPLQPTPATTRAIAEQFSLSAADRAGLTLIARGAMGRIWRLGDDAGVAYAVKELLWGGDEPSVRAEVAFRDAATAAGTIDAPASHMTRDGNYLWALPDAPAPALVRVYDWADGSTVTAPDSAAAGWLGRTLAVLHRLGHPWAGRSLDPWYWRCPTAADWDSLLADAARATDAATGAAAVVGPATGDASGIADASGSEGIGWAEDLAAAIPRLVELTARVAPDPGLPWICCHRDLQPSNVLVHGSRYTLLDWENAGPASPDRELAACLLTWDLDDEPAATTMDEYRRAGGPIRSLTPAAFSMAIATALNYVYVQGRASLDPQLNSDDRRHADLQCSGALATLPSPERMDSLLAATSRRFGGSAVGDVIVFVDPPS
jgi:Ser/Thr protein kinase RdoA (MazF antagonist)